MRRKVWLAQTPVAEAGKNTLHHPLLRSGQVFGTEVQEALDDLLHLVETKTKHMGQQANGAHGYIILCEF